MLKNAIATAMTVAALGFTTAHAADGALDIQVYNPGEKGIFAVSSEIISGKSEVVLIDAQFARNDAQALVDKIKATGKRLTTVYISHSDPDYYFGLDTIKAAFPHAKIIATAQTVAAIAASMDGKLAYWGPILKDNAPKHIILPEALKGDTFSVDGQPLRIMGLDGPAPERSYVWVSSNKTVLGGVVVMANEHVWIADTQTPASRHDWLKTLASITALKPTQVVPGHFSLNTDGSQPFSMQTVKFTQDYLAAFEIEATRAKNSEALISAMKERYPNLAGASSLDLSAKVIMGEMKWPAEAPKASFPAVGKKVEVRFGEIAFNLDFKNDHTMSFIGTEGIYKGESDIVEYSAVEVRPNVYLVYWHEPKTGSNVVHVEDFENGVVHTNIAESDGKFFHMSGKLRVLEGDLK